MPDDQVASDLFAWIGEQESLDSCHGTVRAQLEESPVHAIGAADVLKDAAEPVPHDHVPRHLFAWALQVDKGLWTAAMAL